MYLRFPGGNCVLCVMLCARVTQPERTSRHVSKSASEYATCGAAEVFVPQKKTTLA